MASRTEIINPRRRRLRCAGRHRDSRRWSLAEAFKLATTAPGWRLAVALMLGTSPQDRAVLEAGSAVIARTLADLRRDLYQPCRRCRPPREAAP